MRADPIREEHAETDIQDEGDQFLLLMQRGPETDIQDERDQFLFLMQRGPDQTNRSAGMQAKHVRSARLPVCIPPKLMLIGLYYHPFLASVHVSTEPGCSTVTPAG